MKEKFILFDGRIVNVRHIVSIDVSPEYGINDEETCHISIDLSDSTRLKVDFDECAEIVLEYLAKLFDAKDIIPDHIEYEEKPLGPIR